MWPKSTRLARTLLASSASFLLCSVLAAGQAAGTTSTAAKVVPVASRLTQPIDDKQLVALKGTVHALANARNDRGAAPDGMALSRIHLAMKRSAAQEADLQQLIQDMHTPGSASYHKWLTPDQFGQRFGPSDADVATLTAWLGQHGFSVSKVLPGKQVLEVSGSVGQFREAFHTQIHKYQVNGQTRYANASEPQIPAALAPVLGGFSSLNDFPYKSDMKLKGTAMYDPATHKAVPNWTYPVSSTGVDFPLAPGDFAVQYNLNPLYAAGTNGTGQTIAIINESNINPTLVAEYRSLFGLPASPVNVIIDGSDPGIDGVNNPDGPNGAAGEAYLDVEIAGSVAPQATIDLVIGGDTALENGLNLAIEHAVFADVAPVLSLSFSGCEGAQGAAANAAISNLWEEAAAQGQTVLVSSGDAGSAGCDDDNTQQFAVKGQAVNGLASTPYNLAIGGTDFYYSSAAGAAGTSVTTSEGTQISQYWTGTASNTPVTSLKSPVPEQPWNNSQYGINLFNDYALGYGTTIAGAGGGASNCATGVPATNEYVGGTCAGYPKPAWQTGAGVPADGVRDTPDLSLFAANGENLTYYPICASDGDCNTANDGSGPVQISGVGGTSTSTPAFAGIMALVNQKYGPQGQAGFVLYPLATHFPSAFHDVVNGTNTVPCGYSPTSPNCIAVTGAPTITDSTLNETAVEGEIGTGTTAEYNATTGYDLASGLGSVDANNLVTNWGNVSFTASAVTLAPSQTAFVHGTAITVSGTVTPGSAVGSVALKTTSTEPLQAAQGAQAELNGAKPVFTVSGGTYSGSVNYLPGGTYTIFGAYSGDGTNAASTSTPVPIVVTPEASSLLFQVLNSGGKAVTAGSLPYGTQLQLSGQPLPSSVYSTCAVASPPASCSTATYTEPTGTVTFSDNSATLNRAPVNAEGDAEYNGAFALEAHSVTASYSGDSSYNPSSSAAPVTFTIVQDKPDISFYPSASVTSTGISAAAGLTTLTVDVSNSANDSFNFPTYVPVAAPTGTVTITGLGSTTLTFPALQPAVDAITGGNPGYATAEGVTTLVIPSSVPAGTYTISIAYSGDTNYTANTLTGQKVVIDGASSFGTATTITATPSATTTSVQAAVQLAVTVSAPTGQAAPTGTVAVIAPGDYEVGAGTLTAGSSNTSTVTLSLNSEGLIQGTNVLSVQYLGSKTDAPSVTTVTIGDGVTPTPSVTLVAGPPITISTAGGTGSSTISVTPQAGFTGAVTLSCAVTPSNETDPPTCSISSPPAITGNAAAMATLTVNTTAASASLTKPRFGWLPLGGGVAMATLLFFMVPGRRRRLGTLLGAVMMVALIGFAAGCGGGGTAITPPGNGGTTTGAYTVTVSGTATGVTIAPVTVSVTVN